MDLLYKPKKHFLREKRVFPCGFSWLGTVANQSLGTISGLTADNLKSFKK